MITVPELAAGALGSFLTTHMNRRFGSTHANLIEALQSGASLALECIGNSDALYHNVEHTMLVTSRRLRHYEGTVTTGFHISKRLRAFSRCLPFS